MYESINKFKKIEIALVISLIIIFFIKKLNIIDYGFPFFQQEDEGAFLKSTISYISFITGIKRELSDPFFGPLINLLITFKIIFVNEFILNSSSLAEIKEKIYNDPSILILYGRYCSLIITSLSFFLLYLIFKKLKINFFIYFPLLISLSLSLFTMTISIVNGKNSYYFFFFLLQLYFLIKCYIKIKKFSKKDYLIFSILASFAWGVNYWSSIVSFYAVAILHYKKFKFSNFHFLFYFLLGFILLGIIPSLVLENYFFLDFFSNEKENFSIYFFFESLINKFLFSLKILFNTEIFIFIYIFLFLFYLSKNFKNKKIIILLSILLIEPILIFSVTGDDFVPELRYFSGLISLMFVLSALMIKDISSFYKSKLLIIVFIFINFVIILDKTIEYIKLNNIFISNHSFIVFYEKNLNNNSNILYLIPRLDTRKNLKNLNFYKNLHEKNIIINKSFQKDNYSSILKKIEIEKKSNAKFKNKKILDLNLFNINLFEINNFESFFNEVKKKYKFVSIQENGLETNSLYNYIKLNFTKIYQQNNNDEIYYNDGLRDIMKFLYNGGSKKKLNQFVLGNNYSLYQLN